MKDFNDKFSDCVLTDEDLASVSGGVSGNEKRTIVVCPSCQVEKTYVGIVDAIPDFHAHYYHLKKLGLIDKASKIPDYIKSLWDAAAPVKE